MIVIRGSLYDGKTSAQMPAECRVFDNGAVHVHGAGMSKPLLVTVQSSPYRMAPMSRP